MIFRSVWGFCEHLKTSRKTELLTPMLPAITDCILNLAVAFNNEVLSLLLETLAMILTVSGNHCSPLYFFYKETDECCCRGVGFKFISVIG